MNFFSKLSLFFNIPFIAHSYGTLCDNLDGKTCTHYHSCSWMNGQCQHNKCLNYNTTTCDMQINCHWVKNCNYCVENCNDSSDCFFSKTCRRNTFCKMTKERQNLGCAIMDTDAPSLQPTTYIPTAAPTEQNKKELGPSNESTFTLPTNNSTDHSIYSPSNNSSNISSYPSSKNPTSSPTSHPTNHPSSNPTAAHSIASTGLPSSSPTNDFTINTPSSNPTILRSSTNAYTTVPTISSGNYKTNNTTLQGAGRGKGNNITNMNDEDNNPLLFIIIPITSILFLSMTLIAFIIKLKRVKKKRKPRLHIDIPALESDEEDFTGWHDEQHPHITKRRSLTYPQYNTLENSPSPKPPPRRRLHSAISLGDISRGGEPYGTLVDISF